ncbi:MAG: ABC transporter permease [Spirochaetes bacterium]|nr:ABC transporter permease [Spirochaetota bacterium]
MGKETKKQTINIEAGRTEKNYWLDIWKYRELFYFLSWRDIIVRYKQTAVGLAWSIIRPLLTLLIFTVVFGKLAKLPSEGIPYSILVFSGLLPWSFFSNSFSESSNSLITNSNLISKVYFPKIIIPISSIVTCFVDFIINFILLLGLMLFFRFIPKATILLVPVFFFIGFLFITGFSLYVASLNVKYRDFRYIVPFIVQIGLYLSPVGYSTSIIPKELKIIFSLNPMVGIIDGFRWAITGKTVLYLPSLYLSIVISLIMLVFGLFYFRKTEKFFADII